MSGEIVPAYELWTRPFVRSLAGDAAVLVVLVAIVSATAAAMWQRWRHPAVRERHAGLIVVQFVLLSPLLLSVLLLTLQIVFVVHAKFVVNYAAFTAARSAITVIPTALYSTVSSKAEGFNDIDLEDSASPKMAVIQRAAALACVGISPPLGGTRAIATGTIPNLETALPLAEIATLFPATSGALEMTQQFVSRAQYALSPTNTSVEVAVDPRSSGGEDTSAFAMVTTTVTYRYYLTVPFANRLIGTRYFGSWFSPNAAYYIEVRQQYTMPSETDTIFPGSDDRLNEMYDVERFG